ncbi:restriction endonuclease [Bordetella avium]|uniref:restriction endonuclease n=1 Tax=Bordetella avium TaxID=521 RepID=UPI000E67B875|nr:restriction endonuclease [Bordetella avium]RIQ72926.1 restriction endonuclease [Bordetella avium]
MKLKLSQNSIFAVLLRSPWWMSAGVAVFLCVAAFGALPKDFAAVAVFSAVPFAIISLLSAVRQWKKPSEARVLAVAQAVADMSWAQFADTAEAGFKRDGCEVERLQTAGADFLLRRGDHQALVSARRWKAAAVGVEPLRELQALREKRGAREAIFIALGDVSDKAWHYARLQDVSLMTAPELAQLLRDQKLQ